MEILICLLAAFLICVFISVSLLIKKNRKKQTFIVDNKPVYLTKKDIIEMSKKNFGTHSWYRKTKRK